jgi:hypothetical protein
MRFSLPSPRPVIFNPLSKLTGSYPFSVIYHDESAWMTAGIYVCSSKSIRACLLTARLAD